MQKQKDNQVFHFVTIGIVKLLWIHSRTALFLFLFPAWLFAFMQLGVVIGLSLSEVAFSSGFYFIAAICFLLILGSLWLGFRAAQGLCRMIALGQIGLATLFSLIATYRNIFNSSGPPFEPDSVETVLAVCIMVVLFVVTILADILRVFMDRRALE
jgi:hypothetical protein